jgi:hypothetical protein
VAIRITSGDGGSMKDNDRCVEAGGLESLLRARVTKGSDEPRPSLRGLLGLIAGVRTRHDGGLDVGNVPGSACRGWGTAPGKR